MSAGVYKFELCLQVCFVLGINVPLVFGLSTKCRSDDVVPRFFV